MTGGTFRDRGDPSGRSLNRLTNYGKRLRMAGTAASAMVVFALMLVAGTARPAWAKHHHHPAVPAQGGTCGGGISNLIDGSASPPPFPVGSTVTINATVINTAGAGGNAFSVPQIVQKLSCQGTTVFQNCTTSNDDSVTYAGNLSTNCPGTVFTADTSTPGQVTFTPTPSPLVLPAGSSCSITFDETLNNVGDNLGGDTPGVIQWANAVVGGTCPGGISGGAQGSGVFDVFQCSVAVDKEVSCDGGATFFDVSGVDDTDPGSQTLSSLCIGFNAYTNPSTMTLVPATDIIVRYKARNTGSLDATCSISSPDMSGDGTLGLFDSNLGILPAGVTVASIPATQTAYTQIDQVTAACSDSLAASEPDTATLKCQCAIPGGGNAFAPETMDSATFACKSPNLAVTKTCGAADANGNSAVTVSYDTATGTAALSKKSWKK